MADSPSATLTRHSLAETVILLRHGRGACADGGALYRVQPREGRLCARAEEWPWSSARYHLGGSPDGLTVAVAYLSRIADWGRFLEGALSAEDEARLGYFTETGYPMGATGWLADLETKSARRLMPRRRGRPRAGED